MKELSIEDKAKRYDDAISKMKEIITMDNATTSSIEIGEYVFPELKSEDEKIRKELITHFKNTRCVTKEGAEKILKWITWLEKQDSNKEYVFRPVAGTMIENAVKQALKQGDVVLAFNGFYTPVKGKTSDEILAEYDCWIDKQSKNKPDFSNIRIWKYIVDMVLTERDGIGQYLDNPDTERIAKKLQEKYGNIKKQSEKPQGKSAVEAAKEEKVDNQNCVKPADKVKPKFHNGDWVVNEVTGLAYQIKNCSESLNNHEYGYDLTNGGYIGSDDVNIYHLWSIADARDGDVVADKSDGTIGIFQSIGHHSDGGSCNDHSYCFLHCRYDDGFFYADFENGNIINSNDLIPATKEQCDLLFEEMTQAGWEWNSEKKELSKQTLKITPKFCIGQLITDNYGTWYKILNIECLGDWYYKVYDIAEDKTHLELCSDIDERYLFKTIYERRN